MDVKTANICEGSYSKVDAIAADSEGNPFTPPSEAYDGLGECPSCSGRHWLKNGKLPVHAVPEE